jgi:hypothetical protein
MNLVSRIMEECHLNSRNSLNFIWENQFACKSIHYQESKQKGEKEQFRFHSQATT